MAYSGAPDRLGFGESAKPHALLVEIEDDAVACKEILTDAADYRLERIDVSDAQSRTDIERMICEWANTRQAADALVRLTLVGQVPRHLDFDLRAIWQNAQGSFRFLDLRSAASLDPEVDPDDPTVQGRFLRKMLTHLDAATDEQQRQELQNALRYGLAALEGREIPSP